MKPWASEPWRGQNKLILGIDIGTTQSSVSFAHLFDGASQVVQHVAKWPGQPRHMSDSKIPTLVYYDRSRKAVCFGAEALKQDNKDQAEDEGWYLAKHFKLHLHPQSLRTRDELVLDDLPPGVPLMTVYTDFLRYLLQHTQTFFESHVIDGQNQWNRYSPYMLIVLAHPNGWATPEQHFLREALHNVGANYRGCQVNFVTEGEASVHFCMFHTGLSSGLEPHTDLVVCDAGGSTIDTTAYRVEQTTPTLLLKESKASACTQAGGVFVDLECRKYFSTLLTQAELEEEEVNGNLSAAVEDFEATVKKEFVSSVKSHYINFHDNGFKNTELGIRRGRISLSGSTIESFFEKIVRRVIHNVREQMQGLSPRNLLLVGGFGQSEYLRRRMSESVHAGCHITVIDDFTSKAAADGAVIWAAKLIVTGRVTRFAYGTKLALPHDPSDKRHRGRKTDRRANGMDYVEGCWAGLVNKGILIKSQDTYETQLFRRFKPGKFPTSHQNTFLDYIWIFRGESSVPYWVEDHNGVTNNGFERLCRLEGEISMMKRGVQRKHGPAGPYDEIAYVIKLELGGTELCARLQWTEDGTTRTGPISIIPEAGGWELAPIGNNNSG